MILRTLVRIYDTQKTWFYHKLIPLHWLLRALVWVLRYQPLYYISLRPLLCLRSCVSPTNGSSNVQCLSHVHSSISRPANILSLNFLKSDPYKKNGMVNGWAIGKYIKFFIRNWFVSNQPWIYELKSRLYFRDNLQSFHKLFTKHLQSILVSSM